MENVAEIERESEKSNKVINTLSALKDFLFQEYLV